LNLRIQTVRPVRCQKNNPQITPFSTTAANVSIISTIGKFLSNYFAFVCFSHLFAHFRTKNPTYLHNIGTQASLPAVKKKRQTTRGAGRMPAYQKGIAATVRHDSLSFQDSEIRDSEISLS